MNSLSGRSQQGLRPVKGNTEWYRVGCEFKISACPARHHICIIFCLLCFVFILVLSVPRTVISWRSEFSTHCFPQSSCAGTADAACDNPSSKIQACEMAKFGAPDALFFPPSPYSGKVRCWWVSKGTVWEPLPWSKVRQRKSGRGCAKHWEFGPCLSRSFLISGAWFHLRGGGVCVCCRHTVCSAPSAQTRPVAGVHVKPQPDRQLLAARHIYCLRTQVILLSDARGNSLLAFKVLIFFPFIDSFCHFL